MKKTSREIEIEILRLYHVERWKPGTIGRQLGYHHNVIERVLRRDERPFIPARGMQRALRARDRARCAC